MFNVSMFKQCEFDVSRPQALPPPIIVPKSRSSVYKIGFVSDCSTDDGRVDLVVQWQGYLEKQITWELTHNITSFSGNNSVTESAAAVSQEGL